MPVAVAVLMRLAAKTPSMSRHRIEGAISTLVNPRTPFGAYNRSKQDGLYYEYPCCTNQSTAAPIAGCGATGA